MKHESESAMLRYLYNRLIDRGPLGNDLKSVLEWTDEHNAMYRRYCELVAAEKLS